jgi:hypothetical protein
MRDQLRLPGGTSGSAGGQFAAQVRSEASSELVETSCSECGDRRGWRVEPDWSTGEAVQVQCRTCIERQSEDDYEEPPCCSICDGNGHGYPGGPPCPLEVNEIQRWETDEDERRAQEFGFEWDHDDLGYGDPHRFICTDPSCTGDGCPGTNHVTTPTQPEHDDCSFEPWSADAYATERHAQAHPDCPLTASGPGFDDGVPF